MEENQNNEIIEINEEKNNKRENKKNILITSIAVILVLIISVIALASTNLIKSKGVKFIELLTKDQYVVEMVENIAEDYEDERETNYNLSLKKNFLSIIDSTFTLLGNDLVLDANVIKQEDNIDTKASLKLGTFELQSLELIKEDDLIALSVPNLFENYIAINNKNANEVARKLGFISGDNIEKVDDDILKIVNKYGKILSKSINNYIEIQHDVEINTNENKLSTKEYVLTLGEKELNKIALDILEVLKDDDKTIEFLNNYYTKEEIENLYNEILLAYNEIASEETLLEIRLNVLDNKTIKTTIIIAGVSEISLTSISEKNNDYAVVSLSVNETSLNLEYGGKKDEEKYIGKITIKAEEAEVEAAELTISKVLNSTKEPRKINELNVLLLNEATDKELEDLRKEIEINLGISEEENKEAVIYEEGEFKLENPEEITYLLEVSTSQYNKINFGMTKEDLKKIMGEPAADFEVDDRQNMGWYYDKENSIYFISVELLDGKVYKVFNDIASNMYQNIQISKELGTEIKDLTSLVSKLEYGMAKSDVTKILGDKYLEISKDKDGYRAYKWYDKNENILIIEFDSEEKISYIDEVTMDY